MFEIFIFFSPLVVIASTYLILHNWYGNQIVLKSVKSFSTAVKILPLHYFDFTDFFCSFLFFFLLKWYLTK